MFATGMMDPNWWKYDLLNHKWYRDDDAYADYSEGVLMLGQFQAKYIGVHYDGAEGYSVINISTTSGKVSFKPLDDPFEVQISGKMELKCPDGMIKYRVNKIVCENKTLTFTMLKLSSNEETIVTMGIAPEGFTTDFLKDFLTQQVSVLPSFWSPKVATAQSASEWICPCGAKNSGNFCSQCGHSRE